MNNCLSIVCALVIAIITLACFWPTLANDFIDYDDGNNFTQNPNYRGLSPSHLHWMFTTFLMGHYIPLTWVTFGVDYLCWGMDPQGYHLTNVMLHMLNAVLLYILILSFLRIIFSEISPVFLYGSSMLAALFFSIHPLRVESVAWITERRDVLSGFFLILSIWLYLKMTQATPGNKRKYICYSLSILAFILSLLAKAWGITLPAVLLLIDIYPLKRLQLQSFCRVLREKIPYVLFALVAAALAMLAQYHAYAVSPLTRHTFFPRILQAAYGLFFYLYKTILPLRLHCYHSLQETDFSEPGYRLCLLLLIAMLVWFIYLWHKGRKAIVVSWLAYAIIVSPVLGLTQSGNQLVADRYSYISCMPFAILLGGGLYRIALYLRQRFRLYAVACLFTSVIIILSFWFYLCVNLSGAWKNRYTFWEHIVRSSDYVRPCLNLIELYRESEQLQRIPELYKKIIRIQNNRRVKNRLLLAQCHIGLKNYAKAQAILSDFLKNSPTNKEAIMAYYLMSLSYQQQNMLEKQVESLKKITTINIEKVMVIQKNGDVAFVLADDRDLQYGRQVSGSLVHALARYQIAQAYYQIAAHAQAIDYCQQAIKCNWRLIGPYNLLGFIWSKRQHQKKSRHYFQRALQLYLSDDAQNNYTPAGLRQISECALYAQQAQLVLRHFLARIKRNPRDGYSYLYAGIAYMTQRQFDKAIIHLRRAIASLPEAISAYSNLIICYQMSGNLLMAAKWQRKLQKVRYAIELRKKR